ncbi:MAG: hypothetical protein GQ564_09750 [Bacteroidales bacterium]|nr:hypothetical protein [Bacteroidales bacterium]
MDIKKIILIFLAIMLTYSGKSQKLVTTKANVQIDSVMIFPAIGVINCVHESKVIPNESYSKIYQRKMNEILPAAFDYKVVTLGDEYQLSDSLKRYFVNTVPKFSTITDEVFSTIPLGESFNEMIADVPGRYFGIIFYNGFVKTKVEGQLAQSFGLGVATAFITRGMFTVYVIYKDSYLECVYLLIDKKENRFLYYKRRYESGSPLKIKVIEKTFKKISKGFI